MTSDIYREVVKALAYGKTVDEICLVTGVTPGEVKSIGDEEIAAKRAELRGKGYIR